MSAHELPEDLSRWPSDAYELLGVAHGVGARELRRAYTRLIRIYKPEQFPEHFRRIREAYETILRYAEFFGHLESFPEPETAVTSDPPPPAEREEAPAAPAPYRPPEVSELWQIAYKSDSATAYRQLKQLDVADPGRTDTCLPAYWLLVLEPELDSNRDPCDWLARGLEAARLAGPLRELYRREIAENPEEALSERCTRLLTVPAPAGLLADLVEWRWRAAARLKRLTAFVPTDLDNLRPHIVREDEETWLRLLLVAAELLAFAPDRKQNPAYEQCQQEIDANEHLHNRMPDALDHYEFQLGVASGLYYLKPGGWRFVTTVKEIIGLTQSRPFSEVRPLLVSFLVNLTRKPMQVLEFFDYLGKRSPAVLAAFGNLLQQLAYSLPESEDDDRTADDYSELVETFLGELPKGDFKAFRTGLFNFCLREAISPQQAGDSLEALEYPLLSQQIRDDWPLYYAWQACHVMGRPVRAGDCLFRRKVSIWSWIACSVGFLACLLPLIGFILGPLAIAFAVMASKRSNKTICCALISDAPAILGVLFGLAGILVWGGVLLLMLTY